MDTYIAHLHRRSYFCFYCSTLAMFYLLP